MPLTEVIQSNLGSFSHLQPAADGWHVMEFFRQLASQLRQFWARLSVGARALFGLITGLCLVAIIGVGIWAFQPEYAVLFSGLPVEDAAAITSKLDAERVPYQLSGGGTTILVPTARV